MGGKLLGLAGARIIEALGQATLSVLASVDKVGVVEGKLNVTVADGISSLDTQHERVVLVTNLVSPATEAATGVDVHVLELGKELSEDALTLQGGSGVTLVELAVVGRDDLILGLDQVGVDETLNAVLEEVLLIDGLHGGLGYFQHDRPVRTLLGLRRRSRAAVGKVLSGQLGLLLGLVVGRVVGEDGGTVEGAVVLGEVQPALVSDALRADTTQTNTNDVGAGVVETLGEADELLVAHLLGKLVDGHGVDQLVVADGGAISEGDNLLLGVDLGDLTLLVEALLLLGDGVGNSNPDTTSTITGREAESGVGAPVTSNLVEDDVLGDELDIRSGDTLTEPLALHLLWKLDLALDNLVMKLDWCLPWWWEQPRPCSCRDA